MITHSLRPVVCAALSLAFATTSPAQPLADTFRSPPEATRPGCYWYWINDNISKDGITKDLEAMARVGIGRAYIGHIYNHEKEGDTPVGPVKFMSDEWWQAVQWAVREAGRCGIEIGFFNSPGWSQSGGPWVKTSQSMRYLASSETVVDGGGMVDVVLPVPEIKSFPTAGGHRVQATGNAFTAADFQDVRVIAFRQPDAEAADVDMKLATVATSLKGIANLLDGLPQTSASVQGSQTIDFTFDTPQSLQSLQLDPVDGSFNLQCTVEAVADDGRTTTTLTEHLERRGHQGPLKADPIEIPFTPVQTRHLRITLATEKAVPLRELRISRRAVISHHIRKQLGETSPSTNPRWNAYHWPTQPDVIAGTAVAADGVVDLTSMVGADGRLQWNAPAGRWVVMRTGMLPTGAQCAPASPESRGLEADKMSQQHIRDHFDAMVGEFLKRTPADERQALRYVIADSYETGPQNWTDDMVGKFEQRFGYSPVRYLPCLSGRVVGTPDASTRFLWDWRRLISESIAYDYVGGLRQISNEHGLKLWLENYGHWGFPSEFLLYGSQADEVGGEFWESATIFGNIECRAAASCAHTYGRTDVYVEAFTSNRNFKQSPAELKSVIDWVFAAGVNHLILHVNIHQPDDRPPGIIQWFGTGFNRHNTWFEQSKGFIDYVRRCGVMLKQGTPVADVAYYIGEDAPVMTGPFDPSLPDGYDFDHINADVLIHRTRVKDGRICIENGPQYTVLVLPPQRHMTPEVAAAIHRLAKEGATIVGPQPLASPSLQGYPACDEQVAGLTDPMWHGPASTPGGHTRFGEGRVFANATLEQVFSTLGLGPDVTVKGGAGLLCAAAGAGKIGRDNRGGIVFKHRHSAEREIYFLANTTAKPADFTASFRIAGRKPSLWNAVTGEHIDAPAFSQEDGRTLVPLRLDPSESVFVVFTDAIDATASGTTLSNHQDHSAMVAIKGPWRVTFNGIGAPAATTFDTLVDWSKHPDTAIQHYSGTATYTTTFTLDRVPADPSLRVHLGKVAVIADVRLNGHDLGTVWTTPWAVKTGKHLRPGENTLEIRVTNTWNNRLVADAALPAGDRLSHISQSYRIDQKSPWMPGGLIGPVTLQRAE